MMSNLGKIKSIELRGKHIAIGQITFTSLRAFHMLEHDGVHVDMFFDRNYVLQHEKYINTPIFPWSHFFDTYVIVTTKARYEELTAFLMDAYGYNNDHIILLENIEFDSNDINVKDAYDWEWIYRNVANASDGFRYFKLQLFESMFPEKSAYNPYLDVLINNKCTLNCKECFTQMPYYKKEQRKNYNMDATIEDIDHILDAVDYIKTFQIFGGEPLLHPELHKIIQFINSPKAQSKIACANIITNGTLTFSAESIKALKENPLFWNIRISPYGELSRKQYELFSQLNDAGVSFKPELVTGWKKFARLLNPKLSTNEQIIEHCKGCECLATYYINGFVYRCVGTAGLTVLKRVPYDEKNAFDCSKPFTKQELQNFTQAISPAMAYCSGFTDNIPIAEQAEGEIPYKRYE